jgi:hypothetical protein
MTRFFKLIFGAIFYVFFIVVTSTALTRSESGDAKNQSLDMLIRDIVVTQIVPMVRYEFTVDKETQAPENLNAMR